MSLYIIIYQTNFPIGEFELDKEMILDKQPCWRDKRPLLEGNKILLPYYLDMDEFIGSPHARIKPLSANSIEYTSLFSEPAYLSYESEKTNQRIFLDLEKDRAREVRVESEPRIGPIGNFYLSFSLERQMDKFWDKLKFK